MSQESVHVPRIRSVSLRREIASLFLLVTTGFGLAVIAIVVLEQGGSVIALLSDKGGMMLLSGTYLSMVLGLAALAMTRPTVTVSPAGVLRSTLWLELRGRSGATRLPATVILWRELRRVGLELHFRSHGVVACELTLTSDESAIGINITDSLALPIVDAVLARRPDVPVEPAAALVLAALRRQSPVAVGSALQRAACRFAMDRGIYRVLHVHRDWWDQIRRSPELRRDLIANLDKYFP